MEFAYIKILEIKMLVNSNATHNITQINNSKKSNSSEYLHRAIKLNIPGKQNKLEFRDTESGKLVEINIHEAIQRQLKTKFSVDFKDNETVKATGKLEKYLQTMWSKYTNDTNTKDVNNDGYLDKNELLKSKRISMLGYDKNHKVALSDSKFHSHLEAYGTDGVKEVDKFLKNNNINDGKVSVDMDFNGFLHIDKNLDASFSNRENLLSLHFSEDEINANTILSSSDFNAQQNIEKMIKKWAEEQKDKTLNGLSTSASSDTNEVSKKLQVSKKYIDTQADNAKVFSLKA